jgi:hypothetical protein
MKKYYKLLVAFVAVFGFIVINSCSKDTPAATCNTDAEFATYSQNLNTFNANQSAANCTALRASAINLLNALHACNNTASDAVMQQWIDIDCSGFSGGGGGGGGSGTGSAVFWTASDLGYGNITVNCNGYTQVISSYYSSGSPSCGASGCADFNLNPGSYSFSASAGIHTWSGTITVTNGGCMKQQLTGSGGGGGGGNGNLTVWTQTDHGCGAISVSVSGHSGTVTNYYSGVPSCGASGCANFSLAAGTYNVSASCSSLTWSGTATVTSGGCYTLKLN